MFISGHNRRIAAERAGLASVPCWVREMNDATAYMELVRANAQGELTALERGMHALHSGMGVREYAKEARLSPTAVTHQRQAAEVFAHANTIHDFKDQTRQLVEIHASPRWLWPALVSHMVADGWTVEATRKAVAGVTKRKSRRHYSRACRVAKEAA